MLSNIEILTRKYLNFYFGNSEVIYNWRPDFLKNSNTGRNFELDIYYPKLKIAVEVNGFTHKLKSTKLRDEFKKNKCEENGIKLFIVYGSRGGRTLLTLKDEIVRYLFLYKGINLKNYFPLIKKRVPISIRKEIYHYKPDKNALGKIGRGIKWKIHYERLQEIQDKETQGIIDRKQLRT